SAAETASAGCESWCWPWGRLASTLVWQRDGQRVARLVQGDLPAAGDLHGDHSAEAGVGDVAAELDAFGLEVLDGAVEVVAYQIQLVAAACAWLFWMDAQFARRQLEDEPAFVDVDIREIKDVAKERASALGVLCVDDGVGANDHAH